MAQEWEDEENESIDYIEREIVIQQSLDITSIEKYLIYNNPHIISFSNHIFISSALFVAKSLNILPNNYITADFFSIINVNHGNLFHIPIIINETTMAHWKERIGDEVLRLRQHRRIGLDHSMDPITYFPSQDSINNIDSSIITKSDWIEETLSNVLCQFGLNEAQSRAYHLFLKPLKGLLISPHLPSDEVENRCMYLDGSGGMGKS